MTYVKRTDYIIQDEGPLKGRIINYIGNDEWCLARSANGFRESIYINLTGMERYLSIQFIVPIKDTYINY